MSNKDEFKNLRREMQKLKSEHKSRLQQRDEQHPIADRVKLEIEPILKAFVESDPYLELQSNGPLGIYIAYANAKICGITISDASPDRLMIYLLVDSISTCIYSGSFNATEIKNAVKSALLSWYRSVL